MPNELVQTDQEKPVKPLLFVDEESGLAIDYIRTLGFYVTNSLSPNTDIIYITICDAPDEVGSWLFQGYGRCLRDALEMAIKEFVEELTRLS